MMTATIDRLTWDELGLHCCAFIMNDEPHDRCGASCALGSAYCPSHYTVTHLAHGSKAETMRLREFETLAWLVGGGSFLILKRRKN